MSDKITLDRDTFKALAADTRVDILKKLAEHKLTLTDIAQEMSMSPSTIKEHLDRLVEVDLIEADDKGMKWKYYRLTNKGRNVVSPNETKVWILLGTSILFLAGSALSLASKTIGLASYSAAKSVPQTASGGLAESAVTATTTLATAAASQAFEDGRETVIETTTTLAQEGLLMMARAANDASNGSGPAMKSVEALPSARMFDYAAQTTTTFAGGAQDAMLLAKDALGGAHEAANQSVRAIAQSAMNSDTTTTTIVAASESATAAPYLETFVFLASMVVALACIGFLVRKRM